MLFQERSHPSVQECHTHSTCKGPVHLCLIIWVRRDIIGTTNSKAPVGACCFGFEGFLPCGVMRVCGGSRGSSAGSALILPLCSPSWSAPTLAAEGRGEETD